MAFFGMVHSHDYFFGEDHLWLQKVRGNRPRVLNKMLRSHIDFFPKYYMNKGNNAMVRCVRAAAKRIEQNKGIDTEMRKTYQRRGSARDALRVVMSMGSSKEISVHESGHFAESHERMLRDLVEDAGQDEESAKHYLDTNRQLLGLSEDDEDNEDFIQAYIEEAKYPVGLDKDQAAIEHSRVDPASLRGQSRPSARALIHDGLQALEKRVQDDESKGKASNVWKKPSIVEVNPKLLESVDEDEDDLS